ncbi:3-hydroxybutyryl-CoA dehydrogenase [Tropicimonas isoalkanivorans]|uniref:3-hydroxybutyryl-CoA dehydrogenase n=2 Tax=Tropicimonas isoalkanivorans TaxID=441112 RepID=A0A1I1RCQ8_9RHOB|nr:3-hydroxybutyryl-CoA dehydrogenase [Tropicimonas isoalkanivorans]
MAIRTVTVIGAGVLGIQIALQTARHGFDVIAQDISDEALAKAREALDAIAAQMQADLKLGTMTSPPPARARLSLTTDLAQAVANADLVIEAVPENPQIKRDLYARLAPLMKDGAILATNSSTLLPSELAGATAQPDCFLALHFANHIWRHNIAEIMGHPGTDPAVRDEVQAFAKAIGMVPIVLEKEQPGYVLNSLLVPFLQAAAALLVDGVTAPQDVDKVWRIATGAPLGPFQIYDIVGLNTAWHISSAGGPKAQEFARLLKRDFLDKGKLGVASGAGFYTYS